MWRKGNPSALLVELQTGAATVENSMEFPQKAKNEMAWGPRNPLLGLYPKNPETPIQKNLCTPKFIAVQFTIAKYWKQPKCPSANEWIQKLRDIYTMEFYAAERKKELLPFVIAWMELKSITLSEKKPGEKQIPYDLTFNWNISNRRKKQTKYNQRH